MSYRKKMSVRRIEQNSAGHEVTLLAAHGPSSQSDAVHAGEGVTLTIFGLKSQPFAVDDEVWLELHADEAEQPAHGKSGK